MREGAREIQAMQGWRWLVMADLQAEMSVSDFQWPRQILHKKCGKDLKGGGEGGGICKSANYSTSAVVAMEGTH